MDSASTEGKFKCVCGKTFKTFRGTEMLYNQDLDGKVLVCKNCLKLMHDNNLGYVRHLEIFMGWD